jgi:hypothetical protein
MTLSGLWNSIQSTFSFGLLDQLGDATIGCLLWYLAKAFVNWAAIIAGVVLMGYIIYGGIKYMTSTGDPGKIEEAQKTIINAIIGFAIVVLAWSIASLVMYLFNVNGTACVTPISGGGGGGGGGGGTTGTLEIGAECSYNTECKSGHCGEDSSSTTGSSCQL